MKKSVVSLRFGCWWVNNDNANVIVCGHIINNTIIIRRESHEKKVINTLVSISWLPEFQKTGFDIEMCIFSGNQKICSLRLLNPIAYFLPTRKYAIFKIKSSFPFPGYQNSKKLDLTIQLHIFWLPENMQFSRSNPNFWNFGSQKICNWIVLMYCWCCLL